MRILDDIKDRPLKQVTVFLTPDEAEALIKEVGKLLSKAKLDHTHIADDEMLHEMTIVICTPSNISTFSERAKRLIERDE